jgi:hypothetical protein
LEGSPFKPHRDSKSITLAFDALNDRGQNVWVDGITDSFTADLHHAQQAIPVKIQTNRAEDGLDENVLHC